MAVDRQCVSSPIGGLPVCLVSALLHKLIPPVEPNTNYPSPPPHSDGNEVTGKQATPSLVPMLVTYSAWFGQRLEALRLRS